MATLKSFFPTLGAKRRLEPQEGTDESHESATDGDGSASSLAEADSECSQHDCVTPQTSNRRKWQASWVKQFPWHEKRSLGQMKILMYWLCVAGAAMLASLTRLLGEVATSKRPLSFVTKPVTPIILCLYLAGKHGIKAVL